MTADRVFGSDANDLVVPRNGVFAQNGAGGFPIGEARRLQFGPADGVTHTATHVHATDKTGRVDEIDAEILRVSPGPAGVKANTTIVNEGLARWHYNGATGYGISEYLHQLDSAARPVVPIE